MMWLSLAIAAGTGAALLLLFVYVVTGGERSGPVEREAAPYTPRHWSGVSVAPRHAHGVDVWIGPLPAAPRRRRAARRTVAA